VTQSVARISFIAEPQLAKEGLRVEGHRDAGRRMQGMSIAVYSPGRLTHAGQGAVICLPLSYAQLLVPPHYTRVKLRGDLIKSSLHHRQYPLACQVKLLIH